MLFAYALLTTYWVVLVAELVGDKSIYTVVSLSLRFRIGLVLAATVIAFGGKMLVAILFGQFLIRIPVRSAASFSALIFFSAALLVWYKKPTAILKPATDSLVWS